MKQVKVSFVAGIVASMVVLSAVAAVAQDEAAEPAAATWVSGEVQYAASCASPTVETVGDVRQERGYECAPQTWTSDDPRLGGQAALTWNADVYQTSDGLRSVTSATWDIEGPAGGWSCANPRGLAGGSGLFATDVQGTERIVCAGNGENQGLTAILTANWNVAPRSFEGLIINGELAPAP